MAIVVIKSRWIDDHGEEADLQRKVGRLGDDVRLFALHTLGWVRVQEIVRYREVEFDPRAVRPRSIAALISMVRGFDDAPGPWLLKASAYTGQSWSSLTCSDQDIERLIEWISAMAEFGRDPTVPTAIDVTELSGESIMQDTDPVLRAVIGRWREAEGRLDLSMSGPWTNPSWAPRPGSNTKILQRGRDGAVVFCTYQPSLTPLWEPGTVARFIHSRVLEGVPDRALAQRVVRSTLRTLAAGMPRAERFRGPCLRSDGTVENLDWLRVSLPASSGGHGPRSAAGELDSVVVYCRRMPADEQHRMSG